MGSVKGAALEGMHQRRATSERTSADKVLNRKQDEVKIKRPS